MVAVNEVLQDPFGWLYRIVLWGNSVAPYEVFKLSVAAGELENMIYRMSLWRTYFPGALAELIISFCGVPVGCVRWWGLFLIVDHFVLRQQIGRHLWCSVRSYFVFGIPPLSIDVGWNIVEMKPEGSTGTCKKFGVCFRMHFSCEGCWHRWAVNVNELFNAERRMFLHLGVLLMPVAQLRGFYLVVSVMPLFG